MTRNASYDLKCIWLGNLLTCEPCLMHDFLMSLQWHQGTIWRPVRNYSSPWVFSRNTYEIPSGFVVQPQCHQHPHNDKCEQRSWVLHQELVSTTCPSNSPLLLPQILIFLFLGDKITLYYLTFQKLCWIWYINACFLILPDLVIYFYNPDMEFKNLFFYFNMLWLTLIKNFNTWLLLFNSLTKSI